MVQEAENRHVLFVDDNPIFLASIRRLLGKAYAVATAESGEEGLQVLKDRGPFAVVVSDLKMPEMDGIVFLTRVKEANPDAVRILFTGYANLENAIEAVNNGYVFRILTKPCPEKDIKKAVEAGFEQHRLLRNRSELQYLRRIGRAMEGVISGFSALVEARDPYTAGHQRRVAALSVALAERLGLARDRAEGLRMAAMVHDIGKIYVPAEFLNKPGKLSTDEFSIIKHHSRVGSDILSPVDFPWPLGNIVLQHHERLDGGGYPQGLRGDQLLDESKILAVADVVEAMTFHRPYRQGLGLKAALDEIGKNAGRLYDDVVVKACLTLFRDEDYASGWE